MLFARLVSPHAFAVLRGLALQAAPPPGSGGGSEQYDGQARPGLRRLICTGGWEGGRVQAHTRMHARAHTGLMHTAAVRHMYADFAGCQAAPFGGIPGNPPGTKGLAVERTWSPPTIAAPCCWRSLRRGSGMCYSGGSAFSPH